MWRDIRYFVNQFPSFDQILIKQTKINNNNNNDIDNKNDNDNDDIKQSNLNINDHDTDDLIYISSLISCHNNNGNSLENIYNYTISNIIRIFNEYTLSDLNKTQSLHAQNRIKNKPVDGSIYVGIHGISIMYLRILVLIDENKLNDNNIAQYLLKENANKDKIYKNIQTPQNPNNPNNPKQKTVFEYIKNSTDLLLKFVNELSIGIKCKNISELRHKLLTRIVEYVEFILNPHIKYKNSLDKQITLLLGKPGIIAIAIIVFYLTKNFNKYNKYIIELINISNKVINNSYFELLYGQIGYISCIQFIQSFIDNPCYNNNKILYNKQYNNQPRYINLLQHPKILNIMNNIILNGKTFVSDRFITDAPLLWEFYGKIYLCSAHGYCGIIHTLLQMKLNIINKYKNIINDSLLYLLSLKQASGNYPSEYSVINNHRSDHLVQWCHGSPSYVTLFAKYYQVFITQNENQNDNDNDNKEKECINKCVIGMIDGCEHIWQYGLLTKSASICHGVSGNAYSFLIAYNALNKYNANSNIKALKYLYYAYQFANFMCNPNVSFFHEPDNSDSLFEGVVGECCFTMDLLFNFNNPKFPCYDH